jgi:hypothetical protein
MDTTTKEKQEETMVEIKAVFKKLQRPLINLWCRWQDEKEYEDFKNYSKAVCEGLAEVCPKARFQKLTSRPMSLYFELDGLHVVITVRSTSMTLTVS